MSQLTTLDYTEKGLMPIMDISSFQSNLAKFQEFVKGYLVPGVDYGKIPGTDKDTLLKPGAEKLCEIYGFYADYLVMAEVENWDKEPPLFDYTIKCFIKRRKDDSIMGSGLASCNSYEGKYRWRNAERVCPECGKQAIIKGKKEYGGGWLCFKKKDGCGAKFADKAPEIMDQETGKVPNEDIATQKNTILKMAQKRALVAATIASTRSSGIFTQDVEDFIDTEIKVQEAPKEEVAVSVVPKDMSPTTKPLQIQPEEAGTNKLVSKAEFDAFKVFASNLGFNKETLWEIIHTTYPDLDKKNFFEKFTHEMMSNIARVIKLEPNAKVVDGEVTF